MGFYLTAQTSPFYVKANMLTGTFGVYHIKPIPLNETTSMDVVNLFIANLDNNGSILKESDVIALKKGGNQLFAQCASKKDEYIEGAHAIYKKALTTYDSILDAIATKTLSFTEKDTITFIPISIATYYSANIKNHTKRIEKFIKSRSLDRVLNTDSYKELSEEEFIVKARVFSKTIIANLKKNVLELIKNSYSTVESTLLNAMALRYDPHSNFFTETQNKEFNRQLSSSMESFGLRFDEDEDGITIISFVEPGGSAWMSNEINEGDLFVSLKLGGVKYTNEEITANDLQSKIDNTDEKKMALVIRKKSGLTKEVKLIKHKIASDENTVKGYIVGSGGFNIGYLSLPSFYTDSEDQNLPGCANDVAKEILKLEGDSIKGLIIDLRNNGGGSMREAMNLAGIFVDEGALFIYKESNKKPTLMKDINRGSIFKRPIIVLINEASASASELFSNIVKDYNLGLVVGQTSYGKGTAQIVIPLDTNQMRSNLRSDKSTDYIKLTHGKFYRVNCSTHQGTGVVPDIELPSTPGYSIYKESKEFFYLPPDSVSKKVAYMPNPPIAVAALRALSEKRVKASSDFKRYVQCSDSVNRFAYSNIKIPLSVKMYKANKDETDKLFNSFENALKAKQNVIHSRNNTFDKKLNEVSETIMEFNNRVLQSIQNDPFINESFLIFKDLINQ